jgi:hypothetical protein
VPLSGQILSDLVRLGLAAPDLNALEEILKALAQGLGGFGATLWQLRPRDGQRVLTLADVQASPSTGHLYVLAHGFIDESLRCAFHDLPLNLATGQAVLNGTFEVPDTSAKEFEQYLDWHNPFMKEAQPGSMYAVRATFPDGMIGAVTLYRKDRAPIDVERRQMLQSLANSVASLHDAIRDRVAYRLVNRIVAMAGDSEATDQELDRIFYQACRMVHDALRCKGVTVYLRDPFKDPDTFTCRAATRKSPLRKNTYQKSDKGTTATVIREGRPLFILDTNHVPESLAKETGWDPTTECSRGASES